MEDSLPGGGSMQEGSSVKAQAASSKLKRRMFMG